MSWNPVVSTENVVAIHAIFVPTLNGDGEVLMVGGDNHSYAGNNPGQPHDYLHSRRYNCRTGAMVATSVPTPDFDLFCCGHAFLGDGRPIFAGGTAEFPADAAGIHQAHGHFDGHRHCAIYNYYQNNLVQTADMNHEPGLTTGGGRWYPTLCTLGNGDVFIFQGHPEGDDDRHGNNTPERFRLQSGDWELLPVEIGDVSSDPMLYLRLHVLNNGKVFVSSQVRGINKNITIDAFTGATTEICDLPQGAYLGFDRPAVMLMLKSDDTYANRILLCGGATSQLIDLSAGTPTWSTVQRDGANSGTDRLHANALLLPTGQVVLVGGTNGGNDQSPVNNPEIYDPASNQWQTLADPATVLRNYHSSALLLPDGTIWTAGGNSPTQPGDPPGVNQEKIEVFHPPYPAGTRPVVTSCPASATYGSTIDIGTDNGAIINKVVLMRCGSSTHAFNVDQRGIELSFTRTGNVLHADIPALANVVIPGNYMLFTIDSSGRPCSYAKFIRIGQQTVEIITDRSTFSVLEVDVQLPGTAVFQNAFYVVFDGFLPSELSDFTTPPTIAFHYATGGAVVPQMNRVHVNTLFENTDVPPDVPQKVTFVFNVTFTTDNAFNFADASSDVKVTATLAGRTAEATINLIKKPNPYMIDGPTSWLSVDLAVFQMKEGSPGLATIPQGNSGTGFITQLVNRFNDRTIYPGDELHPFNDLVDMQSTAQLEWLETSGGKRVFNYAIAKVRFKAPVPVPPSGDNDAQDLKVFFRMFNSAGTAMQYDGASSGTYATAGSGTSRIAVVGKEGTTIRSVPFFASPRVTYSSALMSSQSDPLNMKTLHAAGNVESVVYFGCWLDFNQPAVVIPASEDATHATSTVNLQTSIRGIHQCLVAEIFFNDDPTSANATPGSSDNLAQRNLVIAHSDNPGSTATHTVQHTFEIRPSQFQYPSVAGDVTHAATMVASKGVPPDVILIHWNNLPADSRITVYMPDVLVDELLALGVYTRNSPSPLIKIDEHTFSFVKAGISYFPVPRGLTRNIPALLTVELPSTVVKGQMFHLLVQQARYYGSTRRILGSFQFNIPVKIAVQILDIERRNLSILKYVRQTMAVTDPWRLVFNRYITGIAAKVDGLGGDATQVPAATDDRWLYPAPSEGSELGQLIRDCCKKSTLFMVIIIVLLLVLLFWK